MQELLKTIRSCLYDPAFYAGMRLYTAGEAIKLYSIVIVILVSIGAAFLYVSLLPYASTKVLDSAEAIFPDNLILTIANGHASINQPEPYFIKSPFPDPRMNNLVVIDTSDNFSSGDLKKYSTAVLVKKDFAVTEDSNQGKISSFAAMQGTTTIQKSDLTEVIESVRPYFIPMVVVGGAFLFVIAGLFIAFFLVLFHLMYLLIPALGVLLLGAIRGLKLTYKESYIIALYASIPVAVLSAVFMLFNIPRPTFVYTLLLLLVVALNVFNTPKGTAHTEIDV